jgi:hypothetical protein
MKDLALVICLEVFGRRPTLLCHRGTASDHCLTLAGRVHDAPDSYWWAVMSGQNSGVFTLTSA